MISSSVIIFFIGFVLAVVIGQKFKINAGIVAIGFGFILTWILGGAGDPAATPPVPATNTSMSFIKAFPVTLFWNYSMPVIFYAFAQANGTLEVLGKKIAYAFRNARWALPIAVYIMAAAVAAAGAGTMNTFIVAPLAWGLCMAAGVTPLIVPVALWSGSFLGAFLPWTSNGALLTGMYESAVEGMNGMAMQVRVCVYYAFLSLVFLLVMFLITRAWKVDENASGDFMTKPEDFNGHQRATLIIIFTCIGLLLVPSIINQFAPNAVCKWMSSNLSIPVTSIIGISLVAILGGASIKETFGKYVNWNMILLITGMGMYCTLANTFGVVKTLGDALQNLPGGMVAPALSLIGSALSFVTSASTVQPMLFTMAPAMATAAGLPVAAIITAIQMGVGVTSFSPVSTGGAASLIGAPAEVSNKLFTKMLVIAVCLMVVTALFCATPLIAIGA